MKKIALALAVLAVIGLSSQAFAAVDHCKKGYHMDKNGKCVRNLKAATPATRTAPGTPATPAVPAAKS